MRWRLQKAAPAHLPSSSLVRCGHQALSQSGPELTALHSAPGIRFYPCEFPFARLCTRWKLLVVFDAGANSAGRQASREGQVDRLVRAIRMNRRNRLAADRERH